MLRWRHHMADNVPFKCINFAFLPHTIYLSSFVYDLQQIPLDSLVLKGTFFHMKYDLQLLECHSFHAVYLP